MSTATITTTRTTGSVKNAHWGVLGICTLATAAFYTYLRASKSSDRTELGESFIRSMSFLGGLPWTVVPYCAVEDGGGNAFGIGVRVRR